MKTCRTSWLIGSVYDHDTYGNFIVVESWFLGEIWDSADRCGVEMSACSYALKHLQHNVGEIFGALQYLCELAYWLMKVVPEDLRSKRASFIDQINLVPME